MKKWILAALAALLLCCPVLALAQETISVYNWGDYIEPEVLELFEQETGIKVIYETFETNEDMYAKIAMGGSSYDVIFPSDYMIERMIQENLLQKINWENIPNIANIDERFLHEDMTPRRRTPCPTPGARWASSTTRRWSRRSPRAGRRSWMRPTPWIC